MVSEICAGGYGAGRAGEGRTRREEGLVGRSAAGAAVGVETPKAIVKFLLVRLHIIPRATIKRKTGGEVFHSNGRPMKFDLLEFWGWSTSDLVSNVTRGCLAEYIVARALCISREEFVTNGRL